MPILFYRKSALIAVRQLHTPWEKRQQIRMERKLMKVYEKELKDETKKQKEVEIHINKSSNIHVI